MTPLPRPAARRLGELVPELRRSADCVVGGLTLDSRRVEPGDLFMAVVGAAADGRDFVDDAIGRGAAAVLTEAAADGEATVGERAGVPVVALPELRARVGEIAAAFFDRPGGALRVLGVTGTNGKTSCTHYLAQALEALGHRTGVCGTLGNGFLEELTITGLTTADPVTVQTSLAGLRDAGAEFVAMEVSSHALAQDRVNGVGFEGALFTNLTRDHLDYHGDMAGYAEAKRRLFLAPALSVAAINVDDAWGRHLAGSIPAVVDCIGYGLRCPDAEVTATEVELTPQGLAARVRSPWGEAALQCSLLGEFSLANVLGVIGLLGGMGLPFDEVVAACGGLTSVPGRMERFEHPDGYAIVVDYAHTPDALAKVLAVLREHFPGKLACVFGCGGERDRGKRPEMGRVAAELADRVVLSDDNPRGEDGDRIIEDIRCGMSGKAEVRVERHRERAIADTCRGARAGDVVLLAGKGHEDYQQRADGRVPYSDIDVVGRLIASGGCDGEGPLCCSG